MQGIQTFTTIYPQMVAKMQNKPYLIKQVIGLVILMTVNIN